MWEVWGGGKRGSWSFLWSGASGHSPRALVCARVWEQLRADRRGCVQFMGDVSMGKCSFVEIDTFYRKVSL